LSGLNRTGFLGSLLNRELLRGVHPAKGSIPKSFSIESEICGYPRAALAALRLAMPGKTTYDAARLTGDS
jgi:hypothetical protein